MSAARFVWYELMTPDVQPALDFYTEVVGWKAQDSGVPGMAYTLLKVGDAGVAGVMGTPPELQTFGAPPTWSGYIAVDDVDAMAARVTEAGGEVLRPASDIPGVGRFAVVTDPQNGSFLLFKPLPPQSPPPMPAPDAPGTVGWHELRARDGATVFGFYAKLFGWTKGEPMDMGPGGIYQLFEIDGVPSGAVMTKEPDQAMPGWRYYVRVDGIDAALERVKRLGGTVTMGPAEVPGNLWVAHARDPQGAVFALMSPKK
jgi:predicted enzyme related to lactoylglutathione lyase